MVFERKGFAREESAIAMLELQHMGSSRKLGSTCKKHPQILINVEIFGKILPEKELKLPKKAVFGHLFWCR